MANVVTTAAYRRIKWLRLIGLVQRLAATCRCVLHSSDEPGELSQWQLGIPVYSGIFLENMREARQPKMR